MTDPAPASGGSAVVVMKFGGTSVADDAGRAALRDRVRQALHEGAAPVVVVSAMGRAGSPYATDTLLGLVDGCEDAVSRDLIASVGETISAAVVANELCRSGIAARALTGADAGILTDGAAGGAAIVEIRPARVLDAIEGGEVPVVAGFQGIGPDGSVTTLGRGGSDTTACALGVALGARAVEIYTDVDGVMSADPRVYDRAAVLAEVGSDELYQMARHGSRVVHTPAAELASASGTDLRVRNTFTDHSGTLVRGDISAYRPKAVATAVSHTDGVARFVVHLPSAGEGGHTAAQARVYRAMADACVSLDMFSPFGEELAFSVAAGDVPTAEAVLVDLGVEYTVALGLGKVTLVGAGMHGVPGVMARVAEALASGDIEVLQTADSHSTISVLVPEDHVGDAVASLHEAFDLGE